MRGGARENSGPKPTWECYGNKEPDSQSVRLPRVLKDDAVAFLHWLDRQVALELEREGLEITPERCRELVQMHLKAIMESGLKK